MNHQPRKTVFDTIRSILKRGFRQSEVDAINAALDRDISASTDANRKVSSPSVPRIRRKGRAGPRRIGPEGVALIKRFEGCASLRRDGKVQAYPDPGSGGEPWTIGWGASGVDDRTGAGPNSRIGPRTVWTKSQCNARLSDDLKRYARDVARAIGDTPTTQSQFDALVSFHYNTGAIARATLTRKHVARDYEGAANEFKRWNKASGRVLKGLVRRRQDEEALYRSGM
ncbi:MAG: lysozyme [Pseudomonadota bacterium]